MPINFRSRDIKTKEVGPKVEMCRRNDLFCVGGSGGCKQRCFYFRGSSAV